MLSLSLLWNDKASASRVMCPYCPSLSLLTYQYNNAWFWSFTFFLIFHRWLRQLHKCERFWYLLLHCGSGRRLLHTSATTVVLLLLLFLLTPFLVAGRGILVKLDPILTNWKHADNNEEYYKLYFKILFNSLNY